MGVLTKERPLAKKRPQSNNLPPQSTKLPGDVIESARIVAALRNESMSDLLGDILRPVLARMEKDELAKRAKKSAE